MATNLPCLAMDPGNRRSAILLFMRNKKALGGMDILESAQLPNAEVRELLLSTKLDTLIIESPKPRGELVSAETFDTMAWIGRFTEIAEQRCKWTYIFHQQTCMSICRMGGAKDPQIRRGLIELFGSDTLAIGNKKCEVCKGKGDRPGGRIPCEVCVDGKIEVPKSKKNPGEMKKINCKTCNGKGDVPEGRIVCPGCDGSKWEHPPGPLAGIATHLWQALAVAVTWLQLGEPTIHSVTPVKETSEPDPV